MASNPLTSSPQTILSNRLAVLSIFVMMSDMFVYDYTRIQTTEVYLLRHFLARDNSMKVSLHKLALIRKNFPFLPTYRISMTSPF